MASIKLKHASGNSTILHSPAANPSSDVTLKLPSTSGTAGQVLKVASANHSATNAELEFAGGGKILQTVRAETTTRTTVSSNTNTYYTTSLTANITPSATSSKVLILASGNYYIVNNTAGGISIFRGGTNLGHSTHGLTYVGDNASAYGSWAIHYLDSPNSTSALTYDIRGVRLSGSDAFYLPVGDANVIPAQIFLAEVAA